MPAESELPQGEFLEGDLYDLPRSRALHRRCPDATNAAYSGQPAAVVWHFRLGGT